MSYKLTSRISSKIDVPLYEKRLSICLTPNGFSFSETSVKDILISFGVALHEGASDMVSLSNDIKELFRSLEIQSFGYDRVELIVPSDLAAWIPDDLYDYDQRANYLRLLSPNLPLGYSIYVDHSTTLGANNVFIANNTMVTAFKIALPGLVVRSQFSKFADSELLKSQTPVICMNLRQGKVDVVAFSGSQMQIANVYDCTSASSLLQIGLDVMHQLQIETPSTMLLLSGDVDRDTYMSLRNYFPLVKLNTGRQYRYDNPEFQHLHSYQYLLNLI